MYTAVLHSKKDSNLQFSFFSHNEKDYNDGKYVDTDFPPSKTSIYGENYPTGLLFDSLEWKRAEELFPDHKTVFDKKIDPADFNQGELGNCWFLASLSTLAEKPELIRRIFDDCKINKDGKYVLNFYKDGIPVKITIDSYLPIRGWSGKSYSCKCQQGQLWAPLIEKGYAKLHGSYDRLKSGECHHAFYDLTGYPSGLWENPQKDPFFWEKISDVTSDNAMLLTAAIDKNKPGHEKKKIRSKGLIVDHAYSVCQAKEHLKSGLKLVQLRNPWGRFEWNGDYSDKSKKWTDELKDYFNLSVNNLDGEFWLSFKEFNDLFDTFSYCHAEPWNRKEIPIKFVNNKNAIKNDIIHVEVPKGNTLSYVGLHQKDVRIKDRKPYIDMCAFIIDGSNKECVSYVESDIDRWSQSNVNLPAGNYEIIPYSSGAHFQKQNDSSRGVIVNLHTISKLDKDLKIKVESNTLSKTKAAMVSLLDKYSDVAHRKNDPYKMKIHTLGGLVVYGIENIKGSNKPVKLFVDPTHSTNLLPANDSYQKMNPITFILPPAIKGNNGENELKTAMLGIFVRETFSKCNVGVNVKVIK